jgi:hypothetical protein
LKLQQTIWRINRSISRSSSVTEALGVIEEMKAAGIDSANEGTYLALITVCRRQQQGERALSIYEVSYSGQTSTLHFCGLGSSVKNANGVWM